MNAVIFCRTRGMHVCLGKSLFKGNGAIYSYKNLRKPMDNCSIDLFNNMKVCILF